ncbi:heavy metal translocating P-type ATPase [Gallibacterium genomosp. 3]|uniref:Copper-exporting P-type ATPase n=1 Tax=Gallibacterium genomosp. 3 TaxID=505345 RepID=A0A1A7Q4N7_9PAST|nr:heavy metal translocating P-type ATPase [Gallibacterium genomosp. 3]OBX08380.1 copper-transporting ATPase [Gallibacterium genomosp. 3]
MLSKVANQRVEPTQQSQARQHVESLASLSDQPIQKSVQQSESTDEQLFLIEGMSCAACVAKVEKAIRQVDQVVSARVNLADNTATVIGGNPQQIYAAVSQAGYHADLLEDEITRATRIEQQFQQQIKHKSRQATVALIVGFALMFAMWFDWLPSYTQLGVKQPATYQLIYSIISLIVAGAIYYSGKHFFVRAWINLRHRTTSMDTLVALGALTSFLLSLCIILFPHAFSQHHLYLDAGLMVIGFVNIGKILESRGKKSASKALSALMDLLPNQTTVIENGTPITIPTKQVKPNMLVQLQTGDKIPVDGTVKLGELWVNEAMLTGESQPIKKIVGDSVTAGTLVNNGGGQILATQTGRSTTLAQMIHTIDQAQTSKPQLATLVDKIAAIFVPVVIGFAVITCLVWLSFGATFSDALLAATSVLVISCPCALGLAIPMSIIVGTGQAAKLGILVKEANGLQQLTKVQRIFFDKTGTLTTGKTSVTAAWKDDLSSLSIAASIEQQMVHPLADAIIQFAKQHKVSIIPVQATNSIAGKGLEATINHEQWLLGSLRFMQEQQIDIAASQAFIQQNLQNAASLVFLAKQQQLVNVFAISDQIKPDALSALQQLQAMGIQCVMLTGDNSQTANAFAQQLGIDKVIAQATPQDKAENIAQSQQHQVTAMVGDGVNDAQAFVTADVAIAMGSGAKVSMETADLTLLNTQLTTLVNAIHIARAIFNNIKLSLFFAFIYNVILIPVAALGLLNPMWAALAMACSSVTVVVNANRLRKIKL